jgi:hypothetical protein
MPEINQIRLAGQAFLNRAGFRDGFIAFGDAFADRLRPSGHRRPHRLALTRSSVMSADAACFKVSSLSSIVTPRPLLIRS